MNPRLGLDTETLTVCDWKELASRENDGLSIGLYWSSAANRVRVDVVDDQLEQSLEFEVDPRDALSAFYHPFAYAPQDDPHFGDSACDPVDLQTQS